MSAPVIALAGNPNCGKTTLFNQLTGLRRHVGNYPGITVEKTLGSTDIGGIVVKVVDLPGTYALTARSPDETVAFEVITRRSTGLEPALTVIVIDAGNLDRNLYLALQLLALEQPMLVALNMVDEATKRGLSIDADALSRRLGVPVVPVVAATGEGLVALRAAIGDALANPPTPARISPGGEIFDVLEAVAAKLPSRPGGLGEAAWILSTVAARNADCIKDPDLSAAIEEATSQLGNSPTAFVQRLIEAQHHIARDIAAEVTTRDEATRTDLTDRLDSVLLHRFAGPAIFVALMALIFESIFAWAEPVMDLIEGTFALLGGAAKSTLPEGPLRDLLIGGVINGVGSVLVFIPQIAILFAAIAVLEDSGYLARAAYMMDRLMARAGLHGRAFVPLLSGFACAIPAIMATRTIETPKDRLVTILVLPLVSCSARLPIYALIISALFAEQGGLLLLAMYLASIAVTITAAAVLKRTLLVSPTPALVLELPPYRLPHWRSVLIRVYQRSKVFVRDAGTVILACSIVLWALLSYPKLDTDPTPTAPEVTTAAQLEHSYAGQLGKLIEPVIAPLGYDWQIGIGLIGSFAAREVLVATLGMVLGAGEEADEESATLKGAIQARYSPLVGLSLMVFFLLAAQCMSTLAIVKRETGGWRWPLFMYGYMTVLAWTGAFVVYQGGRLLGFT